MFELPKADGKAAAESHESATGLDLLLDLQSNFRNLYDNMYKYADRAEAPEGWADHGAYFERLSEANAVAERLTLAHARLLASGGIPDFQFDRFVEDALQHPDFWDFSEGKAALRKDAVVGGVVQALNRWFELGPAFGRPVTVDPSEIPALASDLDRRLDAVSLALRSRG